MVTTTLNRDAQLSTLSKAAYLNEPPSTIGDWTLVEVSGNDLTGSGFFGVAYVNHFTKEVAVAFRGTDGLSDLMSDTTFATGGWSQQFTEAAKFTSLTKQSEVIAPLLSESNGYQLITTGHSLGGGIAQVVAKMFDLGGATYDAPGALSVTNNAQFSVVKALYSPTTGAQISSDFTNYRASGSLISSAGTTIGRQQDMNNLTQAGTISFVSAAIMAGGIVSSGPGGLVGIILGYAGLNIDSLHPMDGLERTMHIAAGLERALGAGAINMGSLPISEATGQAWSGIGIEPVVSVFKDNNGQVMAYVAAEGEGWKLVTADQQTTITLTPSTQPGQPPTCIVQEADKPAYSCVVTEADGIVTRSIDSTGDGATDRTIIRHRNTSGEETIDDTHFNTDGSVRDSTLTRITADRTSIIVSIDANGDGQYDQVETTSTFPAESLDGKTFKMITDTRTNQSSYQLISADGSTSSGNVADNGNVSFYSNGKLLAFSGADFIGSFSPGESAAMADGSTGNYTYDPSSGVVTQTTHHVGNRYVDGFVGQQISNNGRDWSNGHYTFRDTRAAEAADHAAWDAFANGGIDRSRFEGLVNQSTDYLVRQSFSYTPGYTYRPTFEMPDPSPFGAFYESRSAATDSAAAIADKTFRILDRDGNAITASQLDTMDSNRDGQLSGAELDGLRAWADLDEDGIVTGDATGHAQTGAPPELTTLRRRLAQAGMTGIQAADYSLFTAGNAGYRTSSQRDLAAPAITRTAPDAAASNYSTLRQTDNLFIVSTYSNVTVIEWAPNQIKISSNQQNMVGTDNADSFDINYYAQYNGSYFNLNLVQNFYAGGGNDVMGGSVRSDNLWGGTGDDTLLGYEGHDRLYGEDGDDALEGGAGDDTLHGGAGRDRIFGQVGNDIMNGGDGDDIMSGFTGSNEEKQSLAANETDDDTMFGGAGADLMKGGLGNDYMDGGDGNDLVLGDDGDDILHGSAGDDEVDGGTGDDVLTGGAGNDKMFGHVGNDRMWGGDGNDVMLGFTSVNDDKQTLDDDESDDDQMYGGAGNDFMLGGMGRDVMWGGTGKDELQGDSGDDALYGEDGEDRLFGGAGDDVIYGGGGDDIIVGGAATNQEALAAGISDNNFLYGGAGDDMIIGGAGHDHIDGGAGADDMQGGTGDDVYIVNSVNDVILEQYGEGYDTVIASANYILNANVEELRLLEGLARHGTGNSLDNCILGNTADNILDGVTGADIMIGGRGDDTYYVDNAGDYVVEVRGEGTDTVNASISYALGADIENLTLLDFTKAEQGMADGVPILVYGFPKAYELDYMQGNAVAGYRGTCAMASIANVATQARQMLSEGDVVQNAIDNAWCVTDSTEPDYLRGGTDYLQQQALLNSYGIDNDILIGYNEHAVANLIKGGRGVIISGNAGKLWNDPDYLDQGTANHVVTVTGVAADAASGEINGFYIADSGRGLIGDMTRYVGIADFRHAFAVDNGYSLYTVEPIKLWEENINATGNALNNTITGNRADNILAGGTGDDILIGQSGNDTYVFNRGDGMDTVIDTDSTQGNTDILLINGVAQSDLQLAQAGDDLRINVRDSSEQILLKNWYVGGTSGADNHIEQIRTADGLTLFSTDVNRFMLAMNTPPTSAVM